MIQRLITAAVVVLGAGVVVLFAIGEQKIAAIPAALAAVLISVRIGDGDQNPPGTYG